MNDKPPKNPESASSGNGDGSVRPVAGQRLAEARRANDISIAEIAKELHLDEQKVQALEENQFEVLGAPVFAKGHMRKYAELVGVSVDDMLADYYDLNRSVGAPPVVGPRKRKPPSDIALGPWIIGIVMVTILVTGLYWWFDQRHSTPPTASTPGVLEPFVADRQSNAVNPGSVSPAASAAAVDELPEPDQATTPDLAVAAVDLDAMLTVSDELAGGVRLVLAFSGDCWTEVTDANGDRLFFGLGHAGQVVTRNGIPPLQALFGESSNVKVTVDGVAFRFSAADLRGKTARVTIGSR